MSTSTRTAAPKRPTRPVAPTPEAKAEAPASPQAAHRLRTSNAFRAYCFARYEWLRLRAVGAGYLTPANYTPLPLKGDEQLATVQAKVKTLNEWLKRNAPLDAESEELEPEAAPEGKEPKRFEIPAKARQVKCRSCAAPMFWVPTEGGNVAPVNPDGTSHFATCPNADAHRSNKSVPLEARAQAPGAREVEPHIQKFLDIATEMGLSHEKGHRAARLAAINAFLMDNDREPIERLRDLRKDDFDLLEAGLRKRVLRWS